MSPRRSSIEPADAIASASATRASRAFAARFGTMSANVATSTMVDTRLVSPNAM